MVSAGHPRALVLDVESRSAVAGLRALGAAGLAPAALGLHWADAGLWSRHVTGRAVVHRHDGADQAVAAALAALARNGQVIPFPGTEAGIDAIVAACAREPALRAPFPLDRLDRLRSKSELDRLAADAGLEVRGTASGTAAELRTARIRTPCAVKSAVPRGMLRTTLIAGSADALRALLHRLPPDEPVLVQPRLDGRLLSLALVLSRSGRVVSRFQHVSTTTWPVAAGSTVRGYGVAVDEGLADRVAGLCAAAGYWGLVQFDLMEGPAGPVLIDANPRYYASLPIALASGVNLAAAWYAVAAGIEPPRAHGYRAGVGFRWLEADLIAFAQGRRERLWRTPPRPRVGAVWDAQDPVPGALLFAQAFAGRARARLRVPRAASRRARVEPARAV